MNQSPPFIVRRSAFIISFMLSLVALSGVVVPVGESVAAAQRSKGRSAKRWAICPDPTVKCPTTVTFQPHDLQFRLPQTAVIWESEMFYAVILKSMRDTTEDCTAFIPEAERLDAQKLFPRHKVFATRCQEPGELFYTNTSPDQRFIAVYAGRTRAEAAKMFEQVKATGKFPGANLRRMRAGFNGT